MINTRSAVLLLMALLLMALLVAACGGGDRASGADDAATPSARSLTSSDAVTDSDVRRYPDIVEVELARTGENTYNVTVTVSSPYDTPQRYADGWRVLAPDGTELGTHTLAHDHAAVQPFTRTQTGVKIPESLAEVTVEGRDQRFGYGGATMTVAVPRVDG